MECALNAIYFIAKEVFMKLFWIQRASACGAGAAAMALLVSCASTTPEPSASSGSERYRCEHGIAFTARFSGESVAIDSTRGYELLFRDAKPVPNPSKPNEYRNPVMSAEFKLGADGREALLRYPLLPLAVRCVKDF
jgi:hypothetical protein